ncbi:flagellar basal body-associated FliL family protein [Desulfofalx alkaliphila]|uniref:flagellar basal body-associated FliL family protein n=1 Tax=Desulfofalx alkaliphila TaxID=105483 RepID=UPI00068E918D|nr:flagellar basal body-associated FliL family protein [Desulfofalx alkaliphila]
MVKESNEQKKSRFSTRNIIIALLALNMLIAGSAVGYFMFMNPMANAESRPTKMATFELGEMLVNLADPSGLHYLRFTAVLEYPESEKGLSNELSTKKHILKHNVITLLRQKRLADVQHPESVENVQQEVTETINQLLENGQLSRVYFTEYLTQ